MPDKRLKAGADVGEFLKKVIDFTSEEFTAARPKIEGRLAEAKSVLDGARRAVTAKATSAANASNVYVSRIPGRPSGSRRQPASSSASFSAAGDSRYAAIKRMSTAPLV
jgi:hypothetical protein